MKDSSPLTKKELMEKYSDQLLSNGKRPKTIYAFTKAIGISEADFYHHFGGFPALEKAYLTYFFEESLELITKTKEYDTLSAKEKLLNFYYILFENLTMNRSLVLLLLEGNMKIKMKLLVGLRKKLFTFYDHLDFSETQVFENAPEPIKTLTQKSRKKALWLHFLSILKFWAEDDSPDFEQTDVYIEKSVDTGFELIDHPVFDKFLDLGKFLWKEKFQAFA